MINKIINFTFLALFLIGCDSAIETEIKVSDLQNIKEQFIKE